MDPSSMAMDEQLLEEDSFSVQLQVGEEIALIPWDDEPFMITHVFLVDPESVAGGQRIVAAACIKTTCGKMGTQNIKLAELSSEMTEVELETPVVLDEEFCFYVTQLRGDNFHADTNTNEDAVVVQFKGFVLYPDEESEEEEEEEGAEEAASSGDDDDDGSDEDSEEQEEDEESDGKVDTDVDRVTSAGGKAEEKQS